MRRAIASLLLAVLGFPLITLASLADPRPELPACCRRDGKHHCASAAAEQASPVGAVIQGVQPKCPFFPNAGAVPAGSKIAVVAIPASMVAGNHFSLRTEDPSCRQPRTAVRGFEYKRGPPPAIS